MFIKYKGQTGALLSDLSIELNSSSVNLKSSEEVLKNFFRLAVMDLSSEKSITIISNLPSFLKPFCTLKNKSEVNRSDLFSESKIKYTLKAIFKILDKYVPPENLAKIFACFPETIFSCYFSERNHAKGMMEVRIS